MHGECDRDSVVNSGIRDTSLRCSVVVVGGRIFCNECCYADHARLGTGRQ